MPHVLMGVLVWFMFSSQVVAQEKALKIAVFPYVSPSKILLHNKGLKHFLQKELDRPVSIITAKSSREYIDNVKKGSYDILFAAPHIGRYSEVDFSYQRIAMTKNKIQGYYVVKKTSNMKSLTDAANKTIAMASPLTILHQIALQDLKAHGVEEGNNLTINVTKNHMNAIFSLLKGTSDLALTGVKLWKNLDEKYKGELRLLDKSTKVSGFLIMGNANMHEELREKIQNALLNFHESEEGKKYVFKGFKLIDDESMKSLDKYTYILD